MSEDRSESETSNLHNKQRASWVAVAPWWLMGVAMAVIALSFLFVLVVRPDHFELAGMGFGKTPKNDDLSNAVIAFDQPAGCPDGWSQFKLADGRMIVGVGSGDGLTPRAYRDFNGLEEVALERGQMPSHRHNYRITTFDNQASGPIAGLMKNSTSKYVNQRSASTIAGGPENTTVLDVAEAHDNMPPFIALFFCKMDEPAP